MGVFWRRPDKDIDWFAQQLQLKLREIQHGRAHPGLDLGHAMREIEPRVVSELSDQALLQALETYAPLRGDQGRNRLRALLRAEQQRRTDRKHLQLLVVSSLTLIVAALTLIVSI
jgi:hypothetical protein